MRRIIAFIDFFPRESGFVTPIFADGEDDNFYIEKLINGEKRRYILDEQFRDSIVNYNEKKEKENYFILVDTNSHLEVPEFNSLLYAFKFNSDFVIIGDRLSVATKILYGIGTMDDRLSLHKEIKSFVEKTEKCDFKKHLTKAIEQYKENRYLDNYYYIKEDVDDFLQHSGWSLDSIMDFDSESKEKMIGSTILRNKKTFESSDERKIIFRKSGNVKEENLSKVHDFKNELRRINSFMKLLTPPSN